MRLFEAIIDANNRGMLSGGTVSLDAGEFADSLPIVALTCIDARLNPLFPGSLGVPAEKFIWLRNAGNIITGTLSSTMRSISLACAIKGGKEIAIIGHSDCLVCKSSVMQLTERLKALGISRASLPDNLVEYFGLFASERQNVMKACEYVRTSPLIGAKVPVHGLLIDIVSGKLEWVVNGYQSFATTVAPVSGVPVGTVPMAMDQISGDQRAAPISSSVIESKTPGKIEPGEIKFPDLKIGEAATTVKSTMTTAEKLVTEIKHHEWRAAAKTGGELVAETKAAAREVKEAVQEVRQLTPAQLATELERRIHRAARYKIIGGDQRQYGPITGAKLLDWLADDRVGPETPVQQEGTTSWQTLASIAGAPKPPLMPPLPGKQRDGK